MSTPPPKRALIHARATFFASPREFLVEDDIALIFEGDVLTYVGSTRRAPLESVEDITDLEGALVTPGLIDPHTHLVWAGDRSLEFEARVGGASYEEIAAAGGGIRSTVRATRAASFGHLQVLAAQRLRQMGNTGTTTVEIKSGYGLDLDAEMKILEVARSLEGLVPMSVTTTFLGAHAVPESWGDNADGYVTSLLDDVLPTLHDEGLVDAVDVFCDDLAFSPEQMRRVFLRAQALGLPVKAHLDQRSATGGAVVLAEANALSADHVEQTDATDLALLANAGVTVVLLPGAHHFLNDHVRPDIDHMRTLGMSIAIGTDCNPGTSPLTSLPLAMNLACIRFGLTPAEALYGCTVAASAALGRSDIGELQVGMKADLAVWDLDHPRQFAATIGIPQVRFRVSKGVIDATSPTIDSTAHGS
jgi:imidazolonepropionase